jgi:predicted MFS family arabinose efflux permease
MAPLTGYRRWLTPTTQLRANSWMLMTGSLGMVASTLPVQWLMPLLGWRGLFWGLALLIVLSMLVLAWSVPAWRGATPARRGRGRPAGGRLRADLAPPVLPQMLPIGFINYGGMVAVQTLWAGPWMVQGGGLHAAAEAAAGLFAINVSMLHHLLALGHGQPAPGAPGLSAERLIAWGLPLSLLVLAAIVAGGRQAGWPLWALFCVSSTFVALSQPAVALACRPQAAGRALSAYNLVIFAGVFVVQWGIGLLVDAFAVLGWDEPTRFRGAVACSACAACWVLFYAGFAASSARAAPLTPRMNGILIIAHAPLASALRQCVLHVFPDSADAVSPWTCSPMCRPKKRWRRRAC